MTRQAGHKNLVDGIRAKADEFRDAAAAVRKRKFKSADKILTESAASKQLEKGQQQLRDAGYEIKEAARRLALGQVPASATGEAADAEDLRRQEAGVSPRARAYALWFAAVRTQSASWRGSSAGNPSPRIALQFGTSARTLSATADSRLALLATSH